MGLFKSLFGGDAKSGKLLETTDATFDNDILNSELPILLDFWSPTCMPCQVMGGLLRELVPEYADRVKIFKLNVAQNPTSAQRFRIHGVPTLVFIHHGRIVDQVVGLVLLDILRQKLNKLATVAAAKAS